jgi:trans-aconitate methyltransferase
MLESSGPPPTSRRAAPRDRAKAPIAQYSDEIRLAYPARSDGKFMLKFPRLFILAVR